MNTAIKLTPIQKITLSILNSFYLRDNLQNIVLILPYQLAKHIIYMWNLNIGHLLSLISKELGTKVYLDRTNLCHIIFLDYFVLSTSDCVNR